MILACPSIVKREALKCWVEALSAELVFLIDDDWVVIWSFSWQFPAVSICGPFLLGTVLNGESSNPLLGAGPCVEDRLRHKSSCQESESGEDRGLVSHQTFLSPRLFSRVFALPGTVEPTCSLLSQVNLIPVFSRVSFPGTQDGGGEGYLVCLGPSWF